MKRTLFAFALMIVTNLFGQTTDEQAVRKTVDELAVAVRANNADALGELLTDDYSFVSPRGQLLSKTQRVEGMKTAQTAFELFNYEDVRIRMYGNIAVVTARVNVKFKEQEATTALTTMTLMKKAGKWLLVASQATPVI